MSAGGERTEAGSRSSSAIDDAGYRPFHTRLLTYSCGGPFCDGYVLGIIALALPSLAVSLHLGSGWQGLIAAASLFGMVVGGTLFGYLTDRVGRQVMYTIDLAALVIASAAQFWVHEAWELFGLRFLLGVAVGADYPIASALLCEFAPRGRRGMLLSAMIGAWWLGYTVSFLGGYAMSTWSGLDWHWMLASSAIPAAIVVALRLGTPESPRWLASKGRVQEAAAIVEKHLGAGYRLEPVDMPTASPTSLLQGRYLRRLAFVCVFWSCQVVPTFAIYTYAPQLLRAFHVPNPALGAALISVMFTAGVIPAMWLVDRVGRRPLLTIPFLVTGVALALLAALPPEGHVGWVALLFGFFALFSAGSSVLQWIYPAELFPTEIRATGLGIATSVSRVSAAIGTFLVPIAFVRFGTRPLIAAMAGLSLIGWLVAVRSAPETKGLSLSETSSPGGRV
jgi:MFS transporter, putative metabolite transport protein